MPRRPRVPREVDSLEIAAGYLALWVKRSCRGPSPLLRTRTDVIVQAKSYGGGDFTLLLRSPTGSAVCGRVSVTEDIAAALARIARVGQMEK